MGAWTQTCADLLLQDVLPLTVQQLCCATKWASSCSSARIIGVLLCGSVGSLGAAASFDSERAC
jgi:hypothetical protein